MLLAAESSTFDATRVLILILIYVAVAAALIWAEVRIIRRSGYSGWWLLIGFVPIVNIVMFLVWAFKEWPIQRELNQLRAWAAQAGYHPAGYGQFDREKPGYRQSRYGSDYRQSGYGQDP